MAELSSGKAGQQENAPVDLDAAGLATNGTNGVGPTNGQVALEAQRVVGPASRQSPTDQQLQQLQVSTQGVSTNGAEVMTLAQAQEILKSIGNSEITIGPNSSAQAGQAQAQIQNTNGAQSANGIQTPPVQTGGPVNLDQLAAQGDQQQAAQQQTQPVQQAQQVQQQVQQQQQAATQVSRPVITDDTLIPTPFGEMKLSEAKSLMMRRKDWEKKERDLMEKTRLVDGQASLIQKAAQSKFGATFIAALNAGGSEDDAVRAGLSAYGQAPVQAQPAQPEPILPPDKEDPYFEAKWAEYLAKLTARSASEAVDARLRPLEQRLVQQEQAQTNAYAQAQRAQVDAQATLQHNRDLFHIYVDPYLPEGLSDRQREIVSEYLEQVKRQENIPIDMSRRANDSDMRLLATYAFPGGQLPAHVISQLATNGAAPQVQYPFQQAATQQQQQQQQPQLPPTLANLPDWQKNALITQATQVLNMYRTTLAGTTLAGATNANGQLPGIPVQPALYAGANPTASQLSPMNPSPAMRPEDRIRSTLQSIPRSQ